MALSVSDLVNVTVNLSPLAASVRSFGVLMVAGDSDVISGEERFRTYTSITGVAADFGVDAPEYQAAVLYFGQTPKPSTLMIGRWLRVATSGENLGGILAPSEQLLSNWTSISSGGFIISIDGTVHTLSGLDFTGASNLNGVASIITTALSGAGTCLWNGQFFEIESNSTGAGVKASGTVTLSSNPSPGAQAHGTITLSGQPSNGDTVTIKGTVVTFVTGTPSGNQVQIDPGASDLVTAANLQAFLQASADANLSAMTYNTIGLVTTLTARLYGTAANAYTLAKSGTNIAVSGATLASGVAADTLTINGTALTFVAISPGANQILVGPNANATAANLQTFLSNSVDSNITQASYATVAAVTTVTSITAGTAGNSFTLSKSSTAITLSGANLAGGAVSSSVGFATAGSGTDISAQLKMTADLSQSLVPGFDAESPVACAAVLADMSSDWYGLMFQASVQPTDDQSIDVSTFIEALSLTRIYGVTIINTNVLSALVTTDLASRMVQGAYRQSFCQYSPNIAAIASFFGRAFSVNFNANNSTITLMYKQEPSVAPSVLTENQALILKNKRCNVYTAYDNNTFIIQFGVMSGPAYFDEIHGVDWLQNAIQTACYNVMFTSTTKIPQTDAGVNQFVNAISGVCGQGVANGFIAPGIWNADGFGELTNGQFLKTGYYIFAQPIALQSQADRETRVAPPIQVAVKLAGAIQSLNVIVNVNR